MILKYTKLCSVIATSLIAITSLSADSYNGNTKSPNRYKKNQNNPTNNGVQDGYDISINAAALLWKVESGGSEFAAAADRHVDTLNTDYDWGFRVGLSYTMSHDRWTVYANWDYLRAGATDSVANEPIPEWSPFGQLAGAGNALIGPPGSTPATTVRLGSHWHLDYDVVDLALKRTFQFSKWLCFAPHMGLRSAWIYQDQHFTFGKGAIFETEMKAKNHFWGLGIRSGLDTQWCLGDGWSIYGNAAAGLLYGVDKVNSIQVQGDYNDTVNGNWKGNNSFHTTRACGDWALGLRWNRLFPDYNFGLTLEAGYELNIYWDMFESTIPGANAHNGDLTLNGWTFAAKFDF